MSTSTAPGVRYTERPFDEHIVQAVIDGKGGYLSPANRHEAIRRLVAAGHSRRSVARYLGCSIETVHRAAKGIVP